MQTIIMPQVGQDIPSATIVEWRKREGEPVARGEVVLVVESEKALFEVEAEQDGRLLGILHGEGEEVEILKPLGYIGLPGEPMPEPGPEAPAPEPPAAPATAGPARPAASTQRQAAAKASPAARRVARELGVRLDGIEGTGPGGRITKDDVLAAASPAEAAGDAEGSGPMMKALIFDCDGVLVDTERDGHRVAFNRAFARKGIAVEWGVPLYGDLLKVSGGKERMRHYFERFGWPPAAGDRDEFIRQLHALKTDLFMEIVEGGELPLRPGVRRLVDEAIAEKMTLAVCTTSNPRAVDAVLSNLLGADRKARFAAVLAGEVVAHKKPDPEIYALAGERLGLEGAECVVIEDSRNGLLAARGAGMHCVITTNGYTEGEDFAEADAVYPELGDPPGDCVGLADLKRIAAGP